MHIDLLAAGGPIAADIASLAWFLVALGGVTFLVFVVFLVRALIRSGGEPNERHESRLVKWGGVVLPTVIVSVVLGVTLFTMSELPTKAEEGALVIEVTGHQWWWDVYYQQYDIRSANEIRIPIDRRVELHLTSADVVHSFWVPALGGKLDLLPERINTMVLEASEPGVYRGVCAEFCGLQHAKMAFHVVATSESEHDEWVDGATAGREEPADLAVRGLDVFLAENCHECHSIDGTRASGTGGPDLTHVASRQSIAAGSLDNTAENLAEWISNPQLLKPGVDMPNTDLTDEEVEALVAYLTSLR